MEVSGKFENEILGLEEQMDNQIFLLKILQQEQFDRKKELEVREKIEANAKLIQTVMRAKKMVQDVRQVDTRKTEFDFDKAIKEIMERITPR